MKKLDFGLPQLLVVIVFTGFLCCDAHFDNYLMHAINFVLCFIVFLFAAGIAWEIGERIENKGNNRKCVVALAAFAALAILLSGIHSNDRTRAIEKQQKEDIKKVYNLGYDDGQYHNAKDYPFWVLERSED